MGSPSARRQLPNRAALLKRGLVLLTKVRKHMKALPLTLADKLLLNARSMADTIIGHIKAFPRSISLNTALRSMLSFISWPP